MHTCHVATTTSGRTHENRLQFPQKHYVPRERRKLHTRHTAGRPCTAQMHAHRKLHRAGRSETALGFDWLQIGFARTGWQGRQCGKAASRAEWGWMVKSNDYRSSERLLTVNLQPFHLWSQKTTSHIYVTVYNF